MRALGGAEGRKRGLLWPGYPRHRPPYVRSLLHIPRKSLIPLRSGKVPPPEAVRPRSSAATRLTPLQASALYEAIEAAEGVNESGLPDQAYTVPEGTLGQQQPLQNQNENIFDAGHH